jgi:hypothetical protein
VWLAGYAEIFFHPANHAQAVSLFQDSHALASFFRRCWFTQLRAREFDAATFRSFAGEASTVRGSF